MEKAWWRREKAAAAAPIEEIREIPGAQCEARALHYQQAREFGLPSKIAELQSYALYPFDDGHQASVALHDAFPAMKARFVEATAGATPDRIAQLAFATVRECLHMAYTSGDMHYTATLAGALDRNRPRRREVSAEDRFAPSRARMQEPTRTFGVPAAVPAGVVFEESPQVDEPVDQFENLRAALTSKD